MMPRCDNSLGSRGPCNEVLRSYTDGHGTVHYQCVRCEAREAGRCWNCGKPRTNHLKLGVFCAPCGHAAFRMSQRRSDNSPERVQHRKRYDRQRWRDDPVARARRIETRKAWLAANPERVKEYKRREWLRTKAGREAQHREFA